MCVRGLLALWAALALLPAACSGGEDDEQPAAATQAAPATTSTEALPPPTSTGATEQPPAETATATATTTQQAQPAASADSETIADAAARTAAERSARTATSVTLTGPGDVQYRFGGEGAFDFERGVGEVALRLVGGEDGQLSESKAVFADSAVFYRLPAGELAGDKRWLRLDLRSIADPSGVDFGPVVQGAQADPSQYLLWLSALSPHAARLGQEDVRGVPTTRYRAAVDLELLARSGPAGLDGWSEYVQILRDRLGANAVPVEIWVDGDGLVRRLRHGYDFAAEGTATTVTIELFDFGVQVDVEAPPVRQVTVIDDLIRP